MDLITTHLADTFIIFGASAGYIPQYREIKRNRSLGSFSIWVCFVLLICNILRIIFWFGKRFENALLIQSIVMILTQVALLKVCVGLKFSQEKENVKSIRNFWEGQFWNWPHSYSYILTKVQFLLFFTGIVIALNIAFTNSLFFNEILGFLSSLVEVCLGVPQIISNFRNKTTYGLSVGLILSWFLGDFLKTFYFIHRRQPIQFIMCGVMQLTLDFVIFFQMFLYRNNVEPKKKKVN